MLYLAARCVAPARAVGAQGVQDGGIEEDIDDFLAMQRDWGIDGGLRTVAPARIGEVRREAAQACRAVYAYFGLADFTDEHVDWALDAAGSKDMGQTDILAVLAAAHAIRERGLTVVDIVAELAWARRCCSPVLGGPPAGQPAACRSAGDRPRWTPR